MGNPVRRGHVVADLEVVAGVEVVTTPAGSATGQVAPVAGAASVMAGPDSQSTEAAVLAAEEPTGAPLSDSAWSSTYNQAPAS